MGEKKKKKRCIRLVGVVEAERSSWYGRDEEGIVPSHGEASHWESVCKGQKDCHTSYF